MTFNVFYDIIILSQKCDKQNKKRGDKMINKNLLKSAIAIQGLNFSKLAELFRKNKINITLETLYRKVREGGQSFRLWEIKAIANTLNLTD